jgi:hypothetical protein
LLLVDPALLAAPLVVAEVVAAPQQLHLRAVLAVRIAGAEEIEAAA